MVADTDSVPVVEDEVGPRDLGALVARVADRPVVERARFVHRHVDAVAHVVAKRRLVEDTPAALVRYVHAVVSVVIDSTRIHQDITCTQPHTGQLSLLPSAGMEMSSSYGYEVKA